MCNVYVQRKSNPTKRGTGALAKYASYCRNGKSAPVMFVLDYRPREDVKLNGNPTASVGNADDIQVIIIWSVYTACPYFACINALKE